MSWRDLLSNRKPSPPSLTAREAKMLDVIYRYTVGDGQEFKAHPQELFYPRATALLDHMRERGLLEPCDPGENPSCATAITERGKLALRHYYDQQEDDDV